MFNPKKLFVSNIFIIFLKRYRLLAEILLTAIKSDAASQYTEWLVILAEKFCI